MGGFYDFKLHLIINDQGGMIWISIKVTTTNVDDRKFVHDMTDHLWGSHSEDKKYISGSLESILTKK
ncbi:Mobile element protein [Candidatus Enterovibrio escicola]|uniref:Mobile element protein n=1 Tax=Candidatus Enterovibrio escicola TaxID=1927127 RepID=A0A2A5T6B9_9GAMM|nr:Mobile element protein [Candidatus Enterovibrio escacola]